MAATKVEDAAGRDALWKEVTALQRPRALAGTQSSTTACSRGEDAFMSAFRSAQSATMGPAGPWKDLSSALRPWKDKTTTSYFFLFFFMKLPQ